MKTVVISTLGCKVNQFESAAFKSAFEEHGLAVSTGDDADIVVVNTCAVTASAGAQSRRLVLRLLRRHPRAKIVVCGCYVELEGRRLVQDERLAGRSLLVVGNAVKDRLVSLALEGDDSPALHLHDIRAAKTICRLPLKHFGERCRAYLRVQDGCESFCSYCIVPYTRGPNRSLPPQEALQQARLFAASGHREIVLTGIHLGNYGKDLQPAESLGGLLDLLSLAIPEVGFRLSSLEPMEIDTVLLRLIAGRDNIRPHLHIPLQSGSDHILERMNRRYSTAQFAATVASCLEAVPDLAVGVDVLVGFPGETKGHFEECRDFLATLPCTYLHVFPYSMRPGTRAAGFPDQVPAAEKARRVAELLALGEEKKRAFARRFLGTTRKVLVEGSDGDGVLHGFTDNYILVHFPGEARHLGEILPVRLCSDGNDHLLGEIAQQ